MKRIILVNRFFHPDESATAQLLTDLARHLAAPGAHGRRAFEVVVLTSRQRLEDARARLGPSGTLGGISIRRLWSTGFGRQSLPGRVLDYLSFLAAVWAWLLLGVRRGDVVLAKTDPPVLGVVTTLATLGRGVRRVQWLQDLYPETAVALGVLPAGGFVTRLSRALRNWSLRRSALVVTVSEGMRGDLAAVAAPARVEHIPNWADDLGGEETPRSARGDTRPAGRDLVVGYAGNLGRAHPIEALLELAGQPPLPGVRFAISGGGAHYDRLRAAVAGSREDWRFSPYVPREQLGELLRAPDLHLVILDPRVERYIFPSKVFGILSAGRPILHLGNPDGEVARLVRQLGCGWSVDAVIPAKAGAQLRQTLLDLRDDPAALEQAGRRAREAYQGRYAAAKALAHWDEVLR